MYINFSGWLSTFNVLSRFSRFKCADSSDASRALQILAPQLTAAAEIAHYRNWILVLSVYFFSMLTETYYHESWTAFYGF